MVFISYKYTGEDIPKLKILLKKVQDSLQNTHRVDAFCSIDLEAYFEENGINEYQEQLDYCIKQQLGKKIVLAIIKSEEPSNGMYQELEKAKELKQKYLLLIQRGLEYKEYREYASETIEFDSENQIPLLATKFNI